MPDKIRGVHRRGFETARNSKARSMKTPTVSKQAALTTCKKWRMPNTWQENTHKQKRSLTRGLSQVFWVILAAFAILFVISSKVFGLNFLVSHTRSLNCLDRDTYGFQQPCRLPYCRVMSQNRVISTRDLPEGLRSLVLKLCQLAVFLDQP
jgi:hypothetical protein